jgi:asparagine synthase (glutamine-hydrolysing)
VPRALKVGAARTLVGLRKSGTVAPQTRWAKLPDMLELGSDLIRLYQLAYALFLPNFQRELLSSLVERDGLRDGLPDAMRQRLMDETRGHSPLSAISVLEQRCFLGERLLRDSDAASMAVSLELRLPLVDTVLVQHVNRLADNTRYRPLGRKMVLRRAGLRGLDPKLFDRPKSGFVLPFDRWMRAALGHAMDQTMRDEAAAAAIGLNGQAVARLWQATQDGSPGMYWSRAWAIYVLIRWCHRHKVLL